jgi:syringomycin synthetase protein SyrE
LTALYATAVTGGPDPLDPLKSRYVDFARRQRAWLDGPECRSQRDFWRLTLKGAPTFLDLPTDRPRPAQQTYMGAAIPVRVPDPVTGALRAAARARGITPFMGLLAAWAAVLGARAGANEIVVGAPMANRLDRADEQLIGFFANTVALRVTMDPSSSVRGYLDSVRDVVLDALAHQELPFEKVVETVAPPRSMAYNPLFQVMLALDKGGSGVPELAGVDVASHPLEQVTTHFDLQLSLHDDGDHIAGSLKYAVDLFHAATAKQLVAHFVETLGALLVDEQADNPLDRLIAPMRHASHTDGYVALLSEVLDGEQEADDPDVLALENEISQIWLDLLGHDGFQRNQSFFEIGGTSLAALRMVSRLRESEGAEISLRDVFVHPSITALAKALVRRRKNDCPAASYDALVPVRPVGRQNPLFLVHPVEGSVGYVRSLAPHLPVTLPVFGLAAAGLVEGEQPPSDLNSMVDTYIAAMRRAQPDGPYRIAGWSAGGTLAYAMTEKLMASGERVSFLGLIDTRRIYEKSSEGAALRSWLRPGVDPAEALEAAELAAGGDIEAALALCREHRLISSDIDAAVLRRHLLVRRMISRAVCTYAPRKLSFAPVLVLANEDAPGAVESSWRTLVGDDMRTARVDGDHYSIVEPPYVAGLGRVIGEALGAS